MHGQFIPFTFYFYQCLHGRESKIDRSSASGQRHCVKLVTTQIEQRLRASTEKLLNHGAHSVHDARTERILDTFGVYDLP